MTDTYTAHVMDGDSAETTELVSISGSPQKSIIGTEAVEGQEFERGGELELGTEPATYRRVQGEGYGEDGPTRPLADLPAGHGRYIERNAPVTESIRSRRRRTRRGASGSGPGVHDHLAWTPAAP